MTHTHTGEGGGGSCKGGVLNSTHVSRENDGFTYAISRADRYKQQRAFAQSSNHTGERREGKQVELVPAQENEAKSHAHSDCHLKVPLTPYVCAALSRRAIVRLCL